MANCELCGAKISKTFLGKIVGTVVFIPGSKKPHYVCNQCQKEHSGKDIGDILVNKE
jgi:hypothetical protein